MKARDARVLLTGATGGIGQATAATLLAAGASVLLLGRSPAKLASQARALQQSMQAAGASAADVVWHAADLAGLADPAGAGTLRGISEAAEAWGCNVLVHGAGLPGFGRATAMDAEQTAQVLQLNLLAPMLLTQRLLPLLLAQPHARVVFIGSVLGRLGLPGFSVYSASKFGLRGFAEALRRELQGTGVGVQYLGPRSTRTAFNDADVAAYNQATGTATDDPQVAAQALLALLESGAAERFIGFPERLAVRLNGLAPALLDGSFQRHRQSLPAAQPATPTRVDVEHHPLVHGAS